MILRITTILFLSTYVLYSQGISSYQVHNAASSSLAIGDFDKDGDDDVIGINYGFFSGKSNLELIENSNSGLKNLSAIDIMPGYMPGSTINTTDYDKDGDLDLIVGETNGNMNVLINKGGFNFDKLDLKVPVLDNILIIDLDQDNDIDMIGYSDNSKILSIYTNNGSNNFSANSFQPYSKSIRSIDAADLNGDGKIEIIIGISQFFNEQILLLKNSSPGKYDTAHIANNTFRSLNQVSIIDINRDGMKDILSCNADDGVGAWINKGNLIFEYKKLVSYKQSSGIGYSKFIATDLNGDGHLDLVTGNNSDGILMHINTNKTTLTYDTKDAAGMAPCFNLVSSNLDKDKDNDFFVSNGDLWICENNIVQTTSTTDNNSNNNIGYVINGDVLKFLDEDFQECEVEIWNSMGQMVLKNKLFDGKINLSALSVGAYVIKTFKLSSSIHNSTKLIIH